MFSSGRSEKAGSASCHLVDAATLQKRRHDMLARGAEAFTPKREREVSVALRAYAAMTTSAAMGAIRDVTQIEKR